VALIGAQVVLGAITVFTHNAGWTVALHLARAWLLLAAVTVTAVRVLHPAEPSGAATLAQGFSPAALRLLVLQYAHRILAFGATVAVAWAVVALWRSTPARSLQRLALGWVLALLAATVALGGIVATSGAPPPAQDLHLAAASAVWVGVVVLAVLSGYTPSPVPRVAAADQLPSAGGRARSAGLASS